MDNETEDVKMSPLGVPKMWIMVYEGFRQIYGDQISIEHAVRIGAVNNETYQKFREVEKKMVEYGVF